AWCVAAGPSGNEDPSAILAGAIGHGPRDSSGVSAVVDRQGVGRMSCVGLPVDVDVHLRQRRGRTGDEEGDSKSGHSLWRKQSRGLGKQADQTVISGAYLKKLRQIFSANQ